jgi:hypothetical protein
MKAVVLFKAVPFLLLVFVVSGVNGASSEPKVKQSSSGICHDPSSGSFNLTKRYKAFDSLASCIAQGGRLPKSTTKQMAKATDAAIEQGNAFVVLYDRGDWPHWLDQDKDCQNTRHERLISTSTQTVAFKSDKECNVLTGQWYDPYSGDTFTISKELDLDHVVPLKFAHGHGGDKWSRQKKARFANDPDNLILAQASLNRQKGAKGLADWLPPNLSYRCQYIRHFNDVMAKYELAYIWSQQPIVDRLVKACDSYWQQSA